MNKKEAIKKQCYEWGDMRERSTTTETKKNCCPSTMEYISRADPILRSDLIAFFDQVCRRCGPTKISHFIAIYYEDWPPCVMNYSSARIYVWWNCMGWWWWWIMENLRWMIFFFVFRMHCVLWHVVASIFCCIAFVSFNPILRLYFLKKFEPIGHTGIHFRQYDFWYKY